MFRGVVKRILKKENKDYTWGKLSEEPASPLSTPQIVVPVRGYLFLFGEEQNKLALIGKFNPQTEISCSFSSEGEEDDSRFHNAPNARKRFSYNVWRDKQTHKIFLIVFGGRQEKDYKILNELYYFDFGTEIWHQKNTLVKAAPRQGHSTVVLNDKLIIFGGQVKYESEDYFGLSNAVHILNLKTKTWELPSKQWQNDKDYLYVEDVEWQEDPSSMFGWQSAHVLNHGSELNNDSQPDPREGHSAVVINQKMIIYGGKNSNSEILNDLWILNFASYPDIKWKQITIYYSVPRFGHHAVVQYNRILIFGGTSNSETEFQQNTVDHNLWEIQLDLKTMQKVPNKIALHLPKTKLYCDSLCILDEQMLYYLPGQNSLYSLKIDDIILASFDDLEIEKRVGKGTFAHVYKALLKSAHKNVAFKELILQGLEPGIWNSFIQEIEIMKKLNHPNITPILYMVPHVPHIGMVIPYSTRGTLNRFVHSKTKRLPFSTRMQLLIEIACGMRYLHSLKPPIIHRDLKLENILIFERDAELSSKNYHFSLTAKITDFGLSKVKNHTMTITREAGTLYYAAPEILQNEAIDTKTDVYSFAMIMWEMLTGSSLNSQFSNLLNSEFISLLLKNDIRPSIPYLINRNKPFHDKNDEDNDNDKKIPNYDKRIGINQNLISPDQFGACIQLMQKCWDPKPENRPSFDSITQKLQHYFPKMDFESSEAESMSQLDPQILRVKRLKHRNQDLFSTGAYFHILGDSKSGKSSFICKLNDISSKESEDNYSVKYFIRKIVLDFDHQEESLTIAPVYFKEYTPKEGIPIGGLSLYQGNFVMQENIHIFICDLTQNIQQQFENLKISIDTPRILPDHILFTKCDSISTDSLLDHLIPETVLNWITKNDIPVFMCSSHDSRQHSALSPNVVFEDIIKQHAAHLLGEKRSPTRTFYHKLLLNRAHQPRLKKDLTQMWNSDFF